MRGFGSDNHAPAHPQILAALTAANQEHAPSYGTDEWSDRAQECFRQQFGPESSTYFVFNGTAANVVALRALTSPTDAILCSEASHLHNDEAGAPEFFTGCKLRTLPSPNAKLSLATLRESLVRRGDQHFSQARVLSLTQPTELGTCYGLQEFRELTKWAHQEGLLVHVDGARLANAAVALGTTFRELITESNVDVVSFGGTKNGFLFGEAIVCLKPQLRDRLKWMRKQSGQLPSKSRFIAAQFEAYWHNNLWREIADNSIQRARELAAELKNIRGVEITQPIESNAVFVRLPREWIKPLREKYFFYVWNEHTFECRLMTSWDTTRDDIRGFMQRMKELT